MNQRRLILKAVITCLIIFSAICYTETIVKTNGVGSNSLPADSLNFSWPLSNSVSANNADYNFSSSFGPRLKASSSYAYDFHRGIDIPTPMGTTIHAACNGKIFRNRTSQSGDHYMALRCNNSAARRAAGKSYVYVIYRHLSGALVAENATVIQGASIALSGESDSGFAHLHLDTADGGSYETNNTHPLQYFAYNDLATPAISKLSGRENYVTLSSKQVAFNVSVHNSELDLTKVTVQGTIEGSSVNVSFDFVEMNHITIDKPLLDNPIQIVDGVTITIHPTAHNSSTAIGAYEFVFDFTAFFTGDIANYDIDIYAYDVRGSYEKVNVTPVHNLNRRR